MASYTKRDIRAADMLAMILTGLGALLILLGILSPFWKESGWIGFRSPACWFLGAVFALLGLALNLKVRQLVRTGGQEPEDHDGVPE